MSLTITICTPSYNRAHLLKNLFHSLIRQNFNQLQWIIVDDGSDDDTKSIVDEFIKHTPFDILYLYQTHKGKHQAINYALQHTKSDLFAIIDSDDICLPSTLHELETLYNKSYSTNKQIAGFISLNCDPDHNIIGDSFPTNLQFSNFIDLKYRYNIQGDKWVVFYTKILQQYPFTTFENELFIAESSVWVPISKKHQFILINKPLIQISYQKDGLSNQSKLLRKNSPQGSVYTYSQIFTSSIKPSAKLKAVINCIRFAIYHPKALKQCFQNIYKTFLAFQ